jgi:lysozyme
MKSSSNGIRLIQEFEGLRLTSYLCSAGVATIGYGATYYQDGSKVKLGQTITRDQADQLLKDHLKQFEGSVLGLLNTTKVNQNQFDALVSFCFNLGAGNLAKSQLLRFVKANPKDPKIAAEFAKWNRAGGEVSRGLVRRRKKEAELYFAAVV